MSPAVTDCSLSEPSVHTRAELHRHRWYGWELLTEEPITRTWDDWVWAEAMDKCALTGTYTYRTTGYHRVSWRNGTVTAGNTTADETRRFDC